MTTDSFLALTCAATIGLFFGTILAFAGYRFFLFLLPIWGFFWGFGFGAQAIQAIFGSGFLSDVTSWVVGFFVGLLFAGLSFLFFAAAVALAAGSLGYSVGAGIMLAIGFDMGLLTFMVGVIVAIAFIVAVFALDLYKWVIILATSIMGAGVIVGTFLLIFGQLPTAEFIANPVKAALNDSPVWWLVGLAIAVIGFIVQFMTTRYWTIREYNRWGELTTEEAAETIVEEAPAGTTSAGFTPAMAAAAPAGGMAPSPAPPPAPTVSTAPPEPPLTDMPPARPMSDVPPAPDTTVGPPPDRDSGPTGGTNT